MTSDNSLSVMIKYYNEFAKAISGKKEIAKYIKDENERQFIQLCYGNLEIKIRIDGYNMMFIMKSLYNNEVTNALLS